MFKRLQYRRYLKGKKKICILIRLDHSADCLCSGQIVDREFVSGNIYKLRFIGKTMNEHSSYHSCLYNGKYEMSSDIQQLTYEQFVSIVK